MPLLRHFLLSLFLISLLAACKEDPEEKPAGSITAKISPAGAAWSMTVTALSAPKPFLPKDSNTFLADNLTEAAYTVAFEPQPGFERVIAGRYNIKPGQVIDLGTIKIPKVVVPEPVIGYFSTVLNSDTWRSFYHGSILNDTSFIIWSNSYRVGLPGSEETIKLVLKNFNGPGTYTSPSYGGSARSSNQPVFYNYPLDWSTALAGGNLHVTITKFDTINKLVFRQFQLPFNSRSKLWVYCR